MSTPLLEPGPSLLACHHHASGECRSCTWLPIRYDAQLAAKDTAARDAVGASAESGAHVWLAPQASAPAGFRNKAKMVVTGTITEPRLGITGPEGGVDLQDCPLHVPALQAALPMLSEFVTRAGLQPYDITARRGELKHVLATASPDGELLVRWVLRSREAETRIRKHLPGLQAALPALRVATLNIQPAPSAILEGEQEIVLTEQRTLPMRISHGADALTLHLGPRSFFQTNTAVATALYARGREWLDAVGPATVWDLYCGVGGFALHAAAPGRRVLGVEISDEAIVSARRSLAELAGAGGPDRHDGMVEFVVGDATSYALESRAEERPQMVVVNPPRRGLGAELAGWLEGSGVPSVLYSSCNPVTLGRDLATMASYRVVRAQTFDMFPQTSHAEVLVLLERG